MSKQTRRKKKSTNARARRRWLARANAHIDTMTPAALQEMAIAPFRPHLAPLLGFIGGQLPES